MKSCFAPLILRIDRGSDAWVLQQACHYSVTTRDLAHERGGIVDIEQGEVRAAGQQGRDDVSV
jgi:hypothetical protein